MFRCSYDNCNKSFTTKRGLDIHLKRIHKFSPTHINIHNNDNIGNINIGDIDKSNDNSNDNIKKNYDKFSYEDWNKDEIDAVLELSLKEQYKEFIPDDDAIDDIIISDKKNCVICLSSFSCIAFIDCGHMVTCEKCGNKLFKQSHYERKCPVCRKPIKKILKVYH